MFIKLIRINLLLLLLLYISALYNTIPGYTSAEEAPRINWSNEAAFDKKLKPFVDSSDKPVAGAFTFAK